MRETVIKPEPRQATHTDNRDVRQRGERDEPFEKCTRFTRAREAQATGYYPFFTPIESSEGTEVMVRGESKVMMGSNNYLGLTHHPKVLAAAEAALRRYGSGCTGSRFLNGTLDLHDELEARLACFLNKEAALVFSTGYQTNLVSWQP